MTESFKKTLEELQKALPEENFYIQPHAAKEKILEFEKEFDISTCDMLHYSLCADIPDDKLDEWLHHLEVYETFLEEGSTSIYKNGDIESLIGKKAYKNTRGLFGGLIGVVEKNDSKYGVTPLVLVTGSGRMGVRSEDLVVVEDDED